MPKKAAAKDWRNREQSDWTVATFQQYLKDTHEERYGIAYVARNYGLEGRWLKSMLAEHGADILRKFIDACFVEYRPTPQYPSLNFAFMFTYQRERVLPRILAEQLAEVRRKERAQATSAPITEEEIEWL